MKLHGGFVLLFGIAGCVTALTFAALISGLGISKIHSPQHINSKSSVENFVEDDATLISLRQQAASALASLQNAADNRPFKKSEIP